MTMPSLRRTLTALSEGSRHRLAPRSNLRSWWRKVAEWPPDAFAVTSILLEDSGAYRMAVSPPSGKRWPPTKDWRHQLADRASQWWRWIARKCPRPGPAWLLDFGATLTQREAHSVQDISSDWELVNALLCLHAVSDETSMGLGLPPSADDDAWDVEWKDFRFRANDLLGETDSLSYFSASALQVLPKMRTPQTGMTIRSLSGNLAAARCPDVAIRWSLVQAFPDDKASINLLVVPIPFSVRPGDFRPVRGALDMDRDEFGFFEFEPAPLNLDVVRDLVAKARTHPGGVDGVVFPELALTEAEFGEVEGMLASVGTPVPFLLAGVRAPQRNFAQFSAFREDNWRRLPPQAKHHRWCLDRTQILNYRIGAALHPSRRWCEDIEIPERELRFLVANSWLGICPLICEDLARQDPVARVVRCLGPTLVVALLLDGPQLKNRWPAMYATVLADDPGSSVLTVTALGMSLRSVPPGKSARRTIGLWRDSKTGAQELDLDDNARALLLTLCNEWSTEWMADGRSDRGSTAQLYLGNVEQIE